MISETLNAAADYLEKYGWTRGRMADGVKRCTMGAVDEVCGRNVCQFILTRDALYGWLHGIGEVGPDRPGPDRLPEWNDREGMTADYVIRCMRKCAEERK